MRTTEINTSVGANTPRRLAVPKTSLEPQNLESRGGTQVPTPPKPIAAAPWREKATSRKSLRSSRRRRCSETDCNIARISPPTAPAPLLAIGRVADHIDNLGRNLFHRMRRGAARHTVGQGRRVVHDFALRDVVPDRQQDLLSRHRPGN